ncbi:MAG: hypothetical protein OT477_12030 [Chloroflexi bacterium]|nr:hypothetical protein [Chloroflexota bacterium]
MTGLIVIGTAATMTMSALIYLYALRVAQKRQEAMLQKAYARRRRSN